MKIKSEPLWVFLFFVATAAIYYYVVEIKPLGKAQTLESVKERYPISQAKEKQSSISDYDQTAIETAINKAISEGLIQKLDVQSGKAWIDDGTWALINAEVKERTAKILAAYCAIKKGTDYRDISIMGWQSGKKLGSYTSLGGFKVY